MRFRFPTACAVAAIGVWLAAAALSPAFAQDPEQWLSPPNDLARAGRGETYSLDTLFAALKIAPDETSAKAIEDRIWSLWLVSGSDTCTLLMTRVKDATDDKNYDLAIKLLDAVIAIKPNYVEAWNRRATVFFLKKDYANALADLAKVLTLEPRHFGALTGLGAIMQDLGDDKHALIAFRAALAIDPHLQGVPDKVKTLVVKVDGQDI
jgi:tetratricopeptide (TPR) repeat protein